MKLEWEVEPIGLLFDGLGTQQSSAWTDTGTAGTAISELVSGLDPGTYHWRMRLLYDRTSTPFARSSRWFTMPRNGWQEADLALNTFIGGEVWEDRDGDGLRDGSEPAMGSILVYLLDDTGTPIDATVTAADGTYRFEADNEPTVSVQFFSPAGYIPTLMDQGLDDSMDSDAHPITGETGIISAPHRTEDAVNWSAGLRSTSPCFAPDEPLFVSSVRLVGSATILDFLDGNQAQQISGYNIYRSSDAGLSAALWPLAASNVLDMDEATSNNQWVDDSGDVSPSGIWYYDLSAYNAGCDAEGPR